MNECVELVGIDAIELDAMRQPARFESKGGTVPQPPIDPDKPQLIMPPGQLRAIMTMPDDVVRFALEIVREPKFVQVGHRSKPATSISHRAEVARLTVGRIMER